MKKILHIILIIIFSVALASSCKVGKCMNLKNSPHNLPEQNLTASIGNRDISMHNMNLHQSNTNTFIVDEMKPKVFGTNEDSCDMIILRNGEEISAKVLEIGIHEIKYKKCVNLNGPTISILKNDVFMIKYSNGTKDVMESTDNFSNDNSDKSATIPCNINANKFDIGIEGSPSLVYLKGLNIYDFEPTLGFSGGISFQYNFPEIISIRTNVSLERKGAIFRRTLTDIMGNTQEQVQHSNFNYITFPILIKASLGKNVKYFITAGAFGGYLLNAELDFDIQVTTNSGNHSPFDVTEDYKRLDFGITTGLGTAVPIGEKILLSFEIRNNTGIYTINKIIEDDNYPPIKTSSTNFLIGFSYKFGMRETIK